MKTFYFTFGYGHRYEHCFTIIKSNSYENARKEMVRKFGLKWAFQYTEEQWINKDGVSKQEEFNLKEIK